MKTIGFIGTGNMGGALAKAAFRSHKADAILLANRTRTKAEKLAEIVNGTVVDNKEVARKADYIFLGIEPQGVEELLEEIMPVLDQRKDRYVIVSMMAGNPLAKLEKHFGKVPIIRITPNMPTAVGSGVSLYVTNDQVTKEENEYFYQLMEPSGLVEESDEATMAHAGGVKGCGPAFAAMFVEALADGAVAVGLTREKAYRYAAQMLKGTAEMLLETGEHPGVLKDSVCSPGGSTIQGVRMLEQSGFRAAVINAVIATFEKKF